LPPAGGPGYLSTPSCIELASGMVDMLVQITAADQSVGTQMTCIMMLSWTSLPSLETWDGRDNMAQDLPRHGHGKHDSG
jgi:hypothetical protein